MSSPIYNQLNADWQSVKDTASTRGRVEQLRATIKTVKQQTALNLEAEDAGDVIDRTQLLKQLETDLSALTKPRKRKATK